MFPGGDSEVDGSRVMTELLLRKMIDWNDEYEEENREEDESLCGSGHHTVIPREYGEFVQPGNKVPPRGDVSRNEDAEGEDGKGVHESSCCGWTSVNWTGGT